MEIQREAGSLAGVPIIGKLINTFARSLSNEDVHLKLRSLIIVKFNYLVIPCTMHWRKDIIAV